MRQPDTMRQSSLEAEFDAIADEYLDQHRANIGMSGEGPEYFAEYKIADLARLASGFVRPVSSIFDFGSGIGNSVPYFRKFFGQARLTCGDVSARSLKVAQSRFPGEESQIVIGDSIPLPSASQDLVFSACVFHHIPPKQHEHWLREMLRIARPGGMLAIFEHNPYNPLTVRAVNTCPFDANAQLIKPALMRRRALDAGWQKARIDFRLFFPGPLRALRVVEPYLVRLPFGAQYRLIASRSE